MTSVREGTWGPYRMLLLHQPKGRWEWLVALEGRIIAEGGEATQEGAIRAVTERIKAQQAAATSPVPASRH